MRLPILVREPEYQANYFSSTETGYMVLSRIMKCEKRQKKFISINGTAENTTLPGAGIDFIIAGQAFHWFDADKAKTEFKRIAAPNAWLLLMWNERKQNSPFQQAYEELLFSYAPGYNESTHRNIKPGD